MATNYKELEFVFVNGIIAGHDVGVTHNEFKEMCTSIPDNEKEDAKIFFHSIIDRYSVCSSEILYRIDGTGQELSGKDWKQQHYLMIDKFFQ